MLGRMKSQGTAIHLLGRLSIDCAGKPSAAAFSGRRSELVFAYLAAEHRRDVSRDELADALWPGELPDAWAAALRTVVSDVRRAIEAGGLDAGEVLAHTGSGYRLRLPPDAMVDLDEARSALADAKARFADQAAVAAASAARAADLARLPFLPRHDGDWVDGVRRDLERILVEALELSARAHLRAGDTRAAVAATARLVEAEPYSDAAHRLRVQTLVAAGDRGGALRAYEQCRATFAEELGVEPSAETQAALRALDAMPAPRASPPRPPPAEISPLTALSVLVVDDHDFQRRIALGLLGRLGVSSLAEASDGTEALELLERSPPPDVIVCDIDMPGMDGVEFIRHVAERRLADAVIIASGLDAGVLHAVKEVGEGYGLQVLGTIEKPLTARRLSDLLSAYKPGPSADLRDPNPGTADELRAALDERRVDASFLPIVDLQRGAVSAALAVASWRDTAGMERRVAPERLSAELASRLAESMLDRAAGLSRDLVTAGVDIALWTAIAGEALADVARADRLRAIVREHDADPRRIVLCVPERAVWRRAPGELEVLTRLRVKGFGICLGDYEGGHASDDALARIPLTAVALAPSLVGGAADDPPRAAALEEVLDALRERRLPAVARGCDAAADYELLMQVGCSLVQGEFIAGPLAAGELADWVRGWQPPAMAGGSS